MQSSGSNIYPTAKLVRYRRWARLNNYITEIRQLEMSVYRAENISLTSQKTSDIPCICSISLLPYHCCYSPRVHTSKCQWTLSKPRSFKKKRLDNAQCNGYPRIRRVYISASGVKNLLDLQNIRTSLLSHPLRPPHPRSPS